MKPLHPPVFHLMQQKAKFHRHWPKHILSGILTSTIQNKILPHTQGKNILSNSVCVVCACGWYVHRNFYVAFKLFLAEEDVSHWWKEETIFKLKKRSLFIIYISIDLIGHHVLTFSQILLTVNWSPLNVSYNFNM